MGTQAGCVASEPRLTHPRADVPFDAVDDAQRCVRYLHKEAMEEESSISTFADISDFWYRIVKFRT